MTPFTLFAAYAVLLFVAIYIFVYIPNKKKQKSRQELHKSLVPGDTVITIGGLVGSVQAVEGDYVPLLLDEKTGATAKVVLYSISQKIAKSENESRRATGERSPHGDACFVSGTMKKPRIFRCEALPAEDGT